MPLSTARLILLSLAPLMLSGCLSSSESANYQSGSPPGEVQLLSEPFQSNEEGQFVQDETCYMRVSSSFAQVGPDEFVQFFDTPAYSLADAETFIKEANSSGLSIIEGWHIQGSGGSSFCSDDGWCTDDILGSGMAVRLASPCVLLKPYLYALSPILDGQVPRLSDNEWTSHIRIVARQ